MTEQVHPALLCSYVYLEAFLNFKTRYYYRNWMMDSGAYSAWNSGSKINIDSYIRTCQLLLKRDSTLVEIIALDVINDGKVSKEVTAKQSLKNALYMKEEGLEVIPVFHFGEDYGILREYCSAFDKVGLSCRFGELVDDSLKFYDQCFSREWPKKFHSFGWMEDNVALNYPFHSLDSVSWRLQPSAFGYWRKFGAIHSRGQQDLRSQVKYYLDLEQKVQVKWKKQMKELKSEGPTLRLATSGDFQSGRAFNHASLPDKIGDSNYASSILFQSSKDITTEFFDHFKDRGFFRDPRADIQPNLEKK